MKDIKKLVIIGSGPIIIGQAAEFDYAGTQCLKALKEEGIETVLINSNPATVMTDEGIADKVYIEPLDFDTVKAILEKERPDGMLAGFGGQTGLNLALELDEAGVLEELGISLYGINKYAIEKAEDREQFKDLMKEIGQPVPPSTIADNLEDAEAFMKEIGLPLVIRPAFTLGGTGGGFVTEEEHFAEAVTRGLNASIIHQVLIEKSVAGWKEIEYEVMRDSSDKTIIVCGMENVDPVGVHTGDSIVVAPIMTLSKKHDDMLIQAAKDIVRALHIEGGCNVQFGLNSATGEYVVIEVNPRVSRSSALASKATGYPIARVAAKIALGYTLEDLKDGTVGIKDPSKEPQVDYVVLKYPRWAFDKFKTADKTLGTQMKATGEVMAISNSFESALLKAVTSLEIKCDGLHDEAVSAMDKAELMEKLAVCDDERIFAIAELMRRKEATVEEISSASGIDEWFVGKIYNLIHMEERLAYEDLSVDLIKEAETMGFTDKEIIDLSGISGAALKDIREYNNIFPVYKIVDGCKVGDEVLSPYYYSCMGEEDESSPSDSKKILVVGSGPIRIGQGIEFDYCCVKGVWALKEMGYESIMINNNPETVSTDFDTSDKLYFEALHIDDVMNVIKKERPEGVILQFGGQTALNLAEGLSERGIRILGTSNKSIEMAEDREKFSELLKSINVPQPNGTSIHTMEQAKGIGEELGFPVIVRPSFVIGGRAMQVVYNEEELKLYLTEAVSLSEEHPVLVDKYIEGTEFEIDAIGDGDDVLIPGIMEHIERTGIHSGDSISVYPADFMDRGALDKAIDYLRKIVKALNIVGLVNVQYVYDGKNVYIIEVNPRASRTVPILSKSTGIPMVQVATEVMLGKKLKDMPYGTGLYKKSDVYAVKVPVFSGAKLPEMEVAVGPEMRSTGEALGMDKDPGAAIYKGFKGAGIPIITEGGVYVSLRDHDKTRESAEILKKYTLKGFKLYGSLGTALYLKDRGIACQGIKLSKVSEMIGNGIDLVINVPQVSNNVEKGMFAIRRQAIERGIPVLTCMDTAGAYLIASDIKRSKAEITYKPLFG